MKWHTLDRNERLTDCKFIKYYQASDIYNHYIFLWVTSYQIFTTTIYFSESLGIRYQIFINSISWDYYERKEKQKNTRQIVFLPLLFFRYIWAWPVDMVSQHLFVHLASTSYHKKKIHFTSYSPYVMLMICYCLRSMLPGTRVIKYVLMIIV
jgi:hypothetical protein